MPELQIPNVSEAMVTALRQAFDTGPPTAKETPEQLYVRAGEARVIQYLEDTLAKQVARAQEDATSVPIIDPIQPGSPATATATDGRAGRRAARREGD